LKIINNAVIIQWIKKNERGVNMANFNMKNRIQKDISPIGKAVI